MVSSFVLALREGLEAALIIGIILSVLRKMGRQNFNPIVWKGVFSAIVVSVLTAAGLDWIGAEFVGQGEQLFEGITMFLAAGILTWMVFWVSNQSDSMKQRLESGVLLASEGQGKRAMFFLAFIAIVREGIELALFLLATRLASNSFQEYLGAGLGLSLAIFLGWGIFATSHRLNLNRFFQTTNILLALFAAGLVGLGIHEFNELGWIPNLVDHIWNLNSFLSDASTLGQLFRALIGYDSSPSLSQVIAYIGYLVFLLGILIIKRRTSLLEENVRN